MRITINGKECEYATTMNLHELVESLNLMPQRVIIELNDKVVHRDLWQQTCLSDNDRLEMVSIVGGG
jgi:thiamine biosynthesis protein ThiS